MDYNFLSKSMEAMLKGLEMERSLIYKFEEIEEYDLVKELRQHAMMCYRAAAWMVNPLEIAAYEAGRVKNSVFDISEKLRRIATLTQSRMRFSSISVLTKLKSDILCVADPDRFEICVINLIINSYQNVDQDEGTVKISLTESKGFAEVTVEDDGYAMDPDMLSEVIDEHSCGGLEILKRFCKSVGTEPVFKIDENEGFTVKFKVPLAPSGKYPALKNNEISERTNEPTVPSALFYKLEEPVLAF